MSKNKVQKNIITQDDLDNNPDLVTQGVKVGDEIKLGTDSSSSDIVSNLKSELSKKGNEIKSLKTELLAKDSEIANLKKELAEKGSELVSDLKNTDGKVIVHFGVNVSGKEYSVADILADKDIQKYLLEIGSGAIEKVTKG